MKIQICAAPAVKGLMVNSLRSLFRVCFVKLKLLLVAVALRKEDEDRNEVLLNPGSKVKIDEDTIGFFICQSEDEAKR